MDPDAIFAIIPTVIHIPRRVADARLIRVKVKVESLLNLCIEIS